MASQYISSETASRLHSMYPQYSTSISACGQVMFAYPDPNNWTPQGEGYFDLCSDNEQNIFINVYSSSDLSLIFQRKLEKDFSRDYEKLSDNFYTFPNNSEDSDDEYRVGLSFVSAEEAVEFANRVNLLRPKKKRFFSKLKDSSVRASISKPVISDSEKDDSQYLTKQLEIHGFTMEDVKNGKVDPNTLKEIFETVNNATGSTTTSSAPSGPSRAKSIFIHSSDVNKEHKPQKTPIMRSSTAIPASTNSSHPIFGTSKLNENSNLNENPSKPKEPVINSLKNPSFRLITQTGDYNIPPPPAVKPPPPSYPPPANARKIPKINLQSPAFAGPVATPVVLEQPNSLPLPHLRKISDQSQPSAPLDHLAELQQVLAKRNARKNSE